MPAGNIAGDCQEWRDVVEANGAIPPLVRLLLGPLQHEQTALTLAASQTAAWALSNLLHGSGRQVSPSQASLSLQPADICPLMPKGFARLLLATGKLVAMTSPWYGKERWHGVGAFPICCCSRPALHICRAKALWPLTFQACSILVFCAWGVRDSQGDLSGQC